MYANKVELMSAIAFWFRTPLFRLRVGTPAETMDNLARYAEEQAHDASREINGR